VLGYLKRLVSAGAAYQAGDLLAKVFAVFTLPLYTRHVSQAAYGVAETLLTSIILVSILLRMGVGEAFVRFHYDDEDPGRRDRLAAGTVAFVGLTTTVAAVAGLALAGPLSQALLTFRDPWLLAIGVLGLWAFTNLEIAYSLLRVEERAKTYLRASIANVVISVGATSFLVVVEHQGARGLLAGSFAGTTAALFGLWWIERARLREALRARVATARAGAGLPLRRMFAFGLPTVPVDAAVYALQAVDRAYLFRVDSPAAAGLYALGVKFATIVFVAVRGFQYAWPPLAYSVTDDAEAARLYSLVTTYYVLATGTVVAGVALLGRWLVRLLAAPSFYGAHVALPWLALGWALYGLYLVFVVIAGRARMTVRTLPAAVLGLAVNVVGLVVLVPAWGIAGAGVALCLAYAAMIVATYLLTRRIFSVGFEWGRLARLTLVLGGVAVAGERLLPTHGAAGFASRSAAVVVMPGLLVATGFFRRAEVDGARALVGRLRRRRSGG
jgi:O-antigen/teichoic acid export membrane protein